MKKTKKLTSALIGALTLSMTLGGFVAPPAMAEPVSHPEVIYCAEHEGSHFRGEDYDGLFTTFLEYVANDNPTEFEFNSAASEQAKFHDKFSEGTFYVKNEDGYYVYCNSWSENPIITCDHTDLTHHEAAAGEDCKHFGTIEYWQCNNEDCGKKFSDEACKTEIENTSDGVFGNHDLETKFDDKNHWLACNVCNNTYSDVIGHKYGADISNYTCLGCGYEDIYRYASNANNIINTAIIDVSAEMETYGLEDNIKAAYHKTFNEIIDDVSYDLFAAKDMETAKWEYDMAMYNVEHLRKDIFAEYKAQVTKSLDSLNEELTNAVKYADVHDLSRDAALEILAVINEVGKNEIIAGGTKEGVDNAHETAASSQRSIAEMIFNYGMFDILDGEDITILQNSDDTVSVRADALCERFLGVTVDEELVAPENYTVESGSTIVTFNNDFIKTLAVGKHTVAMVWIDGMSISDLTIVAPVIMPRTVEAPKADDAGIAPLALDPVADKKAEVKADAPAAVAEAVKTNEIPSTGDNNMMTMWLALAAIALAAGTAAVVYKKESR